MRTDADRYADLDTHRTRTNRRADDGSAYDYARAHADQLADGYVVPDLDAVADDLADAGPFAHLEPIGEHPGESFTEFVADVTSYVGANRDTRGWPRPAAEQHAASVGDAEVDRGTDHAFID